MEQKQEEILWIRQACDGSHKAFRNIYEHYKGIFFIVCLRYASSREEAEDFLQESFVLIYNKLQQFDASKGLFEAWARRIVINVCLGHIRKNKSYTLHVSSVDHVDTPDQESILSSLELKDLFDLITMLPFGYRTIFNMYVIDGFTHKEIAERLAISEGTSKSQLSKARGQLQEFIAKKNSVATKSYG